MIKVPSEGNDNPINKVIFYKKPKGRNLSPAVLEDKEVQEMVSINHGYGLQLQHNYACLHGININLNFDQANPCACILGPTLPHEIFCEGYIILYIHVEPSLRLACTYNFNCRLQC